MEVGLLAGGSKRTLETVKILHETVLALRTALEGSRQEISRLRTQFPAPALPPKNAPAPPENHFLEPMDSPDKPGGGAGSPPDGNKPDSGAESDGIDDIELVFTTGDSDPGCIHEDLVPIVDDNARNSLSKTVVVETDISKCGVLDGSEMNLIARRNTLPNSSPYQPILHREILAASRMAPARSPCKALLPATQETAAQTDITALPAQWKSETYLAHKMSCNLTTLPSKFTLPVPRVKRLPLSDKTREARRVLLSDINFTSMVPELSRSADHLHDDKTAPKPPTPFDHKSPTADKFCECLLRHDSRSVWESCCGSRCHASSASIPPLACEETRRRHSWRPPRIVCCHAAHLWSSVPSSPAKCLHHQEEPEDAFCHLHSRRRRTKVRFQHCDPCARSLPNLRTEGDSGESTDSLLDEAEEFLRRSIDSMMIARTPFRRRESRSSDTHSTSGFEPPRTAQPFLPKTVRDLQEDCFVKVITPGGRIAVGKVKYAGEVPGAAEAYVGIELANDTGFSDGGFMGHRFFECDRNHGVFVPFRKVVLAWDA